MNCRGMRFGFVRINGRVGAERAMERLNGFALYGTKLFVSKARFKPRTSFWRKVRQEPKNSEQKNGSVEAKGKTVVDIEDGFSLGVKTLKRISGHVIEEDVRNCKRCLVGLVNTVCSTTSIKARLHEWGFDEVKVWRLGGKSFLLAIEDEDLFLMPEDLNFSYLKGIFTKVNFWYEILVQRDRATWLEVSSLPLHCWNHTTLMQIAEIWGEFEALSENGHHIMDCEKVSVLITTE
ncbi:hypothetical protein V6N13_058968 [Hibiscus sabdariffa]